MPGYDLELSSSERVRTVVCEAVGHRITLLTLQAGQLEPGYEKDAICTACGMTLKEIRATEKANAV